MIEGRASEISLVWHESDLGAGDATLVTLVGCFFSSGRANDEMSTARSLPGFASGRLWVETWVLDQADPGWTGGFFTPDAS